MGRATSLTILTTGQTTHDQLIHTFVLFQWHPALQKIKCMMEDNTGLTFNSMLANLYRDGHDSLAWHSDDETSLGPEPTIASISFGDMRTFQLRKKPPKV